MLEDALLKAVFLADQFQFLGIRALKLYGADEILLGGDKKSARFLLLRADKGHSRGYGGLDLKISVAGPWDLLRVNPPVSTTTLCEFRSQVHDASRDDQL